MLVKLLLNIVSGTNSEEAVSFYYFTVITVCIIFQSKNNSVDSGRIFNWIFSWNKLRSFTCFDNPDCRPHSSLNALLYHMLFSRFGHFTRGDPLTNHIDVRFRIFLCPGHLYSCGHFPFFELYVYRIFLLFWQLLVFTVISYILLDVNYRRLISKYFHSDTINISEWFKNSISTVTNL